MTAPGARPRVVVLDYGSGNVRSAVRALERVGADVELTSDRQAVLACDGLLIPGVGNFSACMVGLEGVRAPELVGRRLAGGRPVLGICVGHQVLFDGSTEPSVGGPRKGLGEWSGTVERLPADVVPHMGWNTVDVPAGSSLFAGVEAERFYFVHSYAVQRWELETRDGEVAHFEPPRVTWSEHGVRFVAGVENGPLSATQFHPEKSGDAGAHLLENWVRSL
jgi:imidazole glycerol-phosphate synthase subunit HisH